MGEEGEALGLYNQYAVKNLHPKSYVRNRLIISQLFRVKRWFLQLKPNNNFLQNSTEIPFSKEDMIVTLTQQCPFLI